MRWVGARGLSAVGRLDGEVVTEDWMRILRTG